MKNYQKINLSPEAYECIKLLSDKTNKPITAIMDEFFVDNLKYLVYKFPSKLNLFYDLSVNGIELTIKLRGQTYNMVSGHFQCNGMSEREIDLRTQREIESALNVNREGFKND